MGFFTKFKSWASPRPKKTTTPQPKEPPDVSPRLGHLNLAGVNRIIERNEEFYRDYYAAQKAIRNSSAKLSDETISILACLVIE